MNIFIKIKNSIYNPQYYKELLQKPFSYSIKYYLLFSLIISIIFGGIFFVKFLPTARVIIEKGSQLSSYYPKELEVIVKEGRASTNIPEPYFIKMPDGIDQQEVENGFDNILVIDTKNNFSLEKFNSYKTVALLTADSFVYVDEQNGVAVKQLKDFEDFKLNKLLVDDFMNRISPYFVILYPLSVIAILFVTFMALISKLVYLLFGALVLWILFKIRGININYKKSYQLGVHLLTLLVVIESVIMLLPVQLHIPFLSTILLIILALINIRKEPQKNIIA
jgi:hypothetical protein